MSSKRYQTKIRGRKRDPNAKRRETTDEGRRSTVPTNDKLTAKRIALSGSDKVGSDFPLDVLHELGFIDQDQRDAGMSFAALAWAVFGFPEKGTCSGIYEQMVPDQLDQDAVQEPRRDGAEPDPEKEAQNRRKSLERMLRALERVPEGARAVIDATQYLKLPRGAENLRDRRPWRTEDHSQMAALSAGLRVLVRLAGNRPAPSTPHGGIEGVKPAAMVRAAARQRRENWGLSCRPWFQGGLTGPLPVAWHPSFHDDETF